MVWAAVAITVWQCSLLLWSCISAPIVLAATCCEALYVFCVIIICVLYNRIWLLPHTYFVRATLPRVSLGEILHEAYHLDQPQLSAQKEATLRGAEGAAPSKECIEDKRQVSGDALDEHAYCFDTRAQPVTQLSYGNRTKKR